MCIYIFILYYIIYILGLYYILYIYVCLYILFGGVDPQKMKVDHPKYFGHVIPGSYHGNPQKIWEMMNKSPGFFTSMGIKIE